MTTEAKLKNALREAMQTQPLSEINVTLLCERCHCHRQTFYYHYQDMYDLLAAIFLTEDISELEMTKTVIEALDAILHYCKKNFVFLRSAYASAASEFVDDFLYSKIMLKVFNIFLMEDRFGLEKEEYRTLSRRYSKFISNELSHWLKNTSVTPVRFEKNLKRFIVASEHEVLPGLAKQIYEEKNKK